MLRQPSWNKTCVKKGTWSPDEDQKLIAYILRYGIWNWNEMPKYAGLQRSGKSCRLRWMNYLRPNIKRGNFTREEEETIIQLQKLLGNRWSAIAARLPQRTDNDIKNHWNTRLKKRELKKYNSAPATKSSTEINSSFKFEQENSSDADSSMLLNILLDSQIPTMGDIPELAAYNPFSPSGCNNTVVADNMYIMEDNFVSSDNFCEIRSFLEQPETIEVLEEDCEAMLPNSQLWLHEPICARDSFHEPVDDFGVNPFI